MAGYTQLNNDILSGSMPDILVTDLNMPVENYISKGLIADIGEMIQKDEELSQKEFMENVFDAYKVKGHGTETVKYNNINVVYTKEAQTADQYIEYFATENGKKYDITVATSDGLEQIIIRGAGCKLFSAREFEEEVRMSEQHLRDNYLAD